MCFHPRGIDLLILSEFFILELNIIEKVKGVKRRITDEARGRVSNPTLSPRHRGDKQYY